MDTKEITSKEDNFICNSGLSIHPFNVDDIQIKGTKVKELLFEYAKEEVINYENWKKTHGVNWNIKNISTYAEELYELYLQSKK